MDVIITHDDQSVKSRKPKGKKKKSSSKAPGKSDAHNFVDEAFTFDDKLTRRMKVQDVCFTEEAITAAMKECGIVGNLSIGITLDTHPLGVMLLEVQPGMAAHNAGMRQGDVLMSVNGVAIRSHDESNLISGWSSSQSPTLDPNPDVYPTLSLRRRYPTCVSTYLVVSTTRSSSSPKPVSEGIHLISILFSITTSVNIGLGPVL